MTAASAARAERAGSPSNAVSRPAIYPNANPLAIHGTLAIHELAELLHGRLVRMTAILREVGEADE